DSLNYLSWACAHQNLPIPALEAAQECWRLRKSILGPKHDDTLAALADLSAMQQLNQDWSSVKITFLNTLALGLDLEDTPETRNYVESNLKALVSNFLLGAATDEGIRKARAKTRDFLAPFLDGRRPRLRARLPFTLAQFGRYLYSQPPTETGIN